MTTELFNIKITGNISEHQREEDAVKKFAQLFKLSEEKAQQIFIKAPKVIRKSVDMATAKKFQTVLNKVGIETVLESLNDKAEAPAEKTLITEGESTVEHEAPATPEPVQNQATVIEQQKPQPGYAFEIEGRPDYAFVTVQLPAEKTLKVEASAMATMDTNIRMKTKFKGGLGRFITGESIFINEFTAEGGRGEIGIAPGSPGDLAHVYLQGDTIFLQNSAYVASDMDVTVETKWQGLTKGFFSGENLFLIRCRGQGDLWFNTYGSMIELDVDGDYVVDTGNIVAFTEGLDYRISKVGGYKSLFFSGEGFVCRFSGSGKVWIQTRGVDAFTSWVNPFRPVKGKG